MQTRSTRRGTNPRFLDQYDRRSIQQAQNARKRAAADSPPQDSPSQPHSPYRLTRSTAARQLQSDLDSGTKQRQRRGGGQKAEQKEGSVIVLDDEGSEEDSVPLQHKRRRLSDANQSTAPIDAATLRTAESSHTAAPSLSVVSPRLRPRPPLLSSFPRPISQLASIGRSISTHISNIATYFSTPPFSSNATHYTRQQRPVTRDSRHGTGVLATHTLFDSRWRQSDDDREESVRQDDDDSIDRAFHVDDRDMPDTEPYLTYPPHTTRGSVTVTYGDLHRLEPNEFLNDTLIEFYLLYIRDRVVPQRLRERFHFFNSFLFTRLSEYGSGGVREVYGHVKGWTKGVNLFEKDWIVIPINDADRHHWSLVVIAHPGRTMRPAGLSTISAALTADRAKQKQQAAAGSVKRANSRIDGSPGGIAGSQKRTRASSPSAAKASPGSNGRQARNGKVQTSIPDLFASKNIPPLSSLLALSSPPLSVPKPPTKPPRSVRLRSHGEQMALLIQQQQPLGGVRRVTRQNSTDPLMSPEHQTTRRLTESKGNIRAAMRSPYSKQQRADDYQQRRHDEEWQRALTVPDEQSIALDTQYAEVDEVDKEEKSEPAPAATASAGSAKGMLPPQYYNDVQYEDAVDDVDEQGPADQQADADDHHRNSESAQQVANENDDDIDIDIETDDADVNAPVLPRITDSVPPTLPLSSQSTHSSTSTASVSSNSPLSSSGPAEAGWRPCILHFDSLRIAPSQTRKIANILRQYLQCEWEHQQQLHGIITPVTATPPMPLTHPFVPHYTVPMQSARRFDDKSFPHYDVDVPQQPNDYDCGVYILHFAELFCREPWDDLRRLDREGWLESRMQKDGDKRRRMRELVRHLHSEEEFERARAESKQQMERELEQKGRERQQHHHVQKQRAELDGDRSTRHDDVYAPDSDDDDSHGKRKEEEVRSRSGSARHCGARRTSSGQRAQVGDDSESTSEAQHIAINRSSSCVPSSQPAEDGSELE